MAYACSHLYYIPATGLRLFIVGAWGRPEMAMYLFARTIVAGTPIKLFNHGNMQRDHPASQSGVWQVSTQS
jgi:UDP-glucuronate 4-epimerase